MPLAEPPLSDFDHFNAGAPLEEGVYSTELCLI